MRIIIEFDDEDLNIRELIERLKSTVADYIYDFTIWDE